MSFIIRFAEIIAFIYVFAIFGSTTFVFKYLIAAITFFDAGSTFPSYSLLLTIPVKKFNLLLDLVSILLIAASIALVS